MNHEAITKIVAANGYGIGITPNPFASQCKEWQRQHVEARLRKLLTDKITSLFEPRFITPPETSSFIEALIVMTESRRLLEIGMCTGFTTLHMLRAIVGTNGYVTAIDARPAHDRAFFGQPELKNYFSFIQEWTPKAFEYLKGQQFDLVFLDSDHTLEHSEKELVEILKITHPGSILLFHDCPRHQTPTDKEEGPIYRWLHEKVKDRVLRGLVLPTAEQLDCLDTWGPGYPQACNPHLGVFIRN